jgi:hypothetical protein
VGSDEEWVVASAGSGERWVDAGGMMTGERTRGKEGMPHRFW